MQLRQTAKSGEGVLNAVLAGAATVKWRQIPHHLESLAIAFALFMLASVAIFGFRVDSALHEWGLFLKHLETAEGPGKTAVLFVMLGVYLVILAIVFMARRRKVGVSQ